MIASFSSFDMIDSMSPLIIRSINSIGLMNWSSFIVPRSDKQTSILGLWFSCKSSILKCNSDVWHSFLHFPFSLHLQVYAFSNFGSSIFSSLRRAQSVMIGVSDAFL